MLKIVGAGVYALRLLCCIVVLGLSVTFITGYVYGSAPVTLKYAAFTGGFGMVSSVVGLAGVFLEMIPVFLVAGLEAISGLLLLGAGIAFAIAMKGTDCKVDDNNQQDQQEAINILNNPLINQGTTEFDSRTVYGVQQGAADGEEVVRRLLDNCKRATADQAFQLIAFGLALGSLFLCYLFLRNGRPGKRSAYV